MSTAHLTADSESITTKFFAASAQTQLVVLHYLAQKIHRTAQSATPSAFFSQKVQGVLKQIQQLPKEERHEALEEILHGVPTRLTEAYADLDDNMRMAFWYRLANSRRGDALLANNSVTAWNQEQHVLLTDLDRRESNELLHFMREAVADHNLAPIA